MDNLIQPCRKYNSIFMMGFIIAFQKQSNINDAVKNNHGLETTFRKRKTMTDKEDTVVAYKYYDSNDFPSIEFYADCNHVAVYDNDYIRWDFTQKKIVDILSSLDGLHDHTVDLCMMGYLDKYFIRKEVEYRHIFKENPYIPSIAFVDNMLSKYELHVACERNIGINESYIKDFSCQLKVHSRERDKKSDKFYATTSIDSNIKFKRSMAYSDFIPNANDITNNMHTWSKYIFQTIMADSILKQVGVSGD